jgi:hypothetical protein
MNKVRSVLSDSKDNTVKVIKSISFRGVGSVERIREKAPLENFHGKCHRRRPLGLPVKE